MWAYPYDDPDRADVVFEAIVGPNVTVRNWRLRHRIWRALDSAGLARLPGAYGRIPNFVGAQCAALRLSMLWLWRAARVIAVNPDTPQQSIRELALRQGKKVYIATPRLATARPFLELKPDCLRRPEIPFAATIEGALHFGRPKAPEELSRVDLIVVGSVCVSSDGSRLGKGSGYSDIGYALLMASGCIDCYTPVVTTVHGVQVVCPGEITSAAHDVSVDLIVTPDRVLEASRSVKRRPSGPIRSLISSVQLAEIPALRHFV